MDLSNNNTYNEGGKYQITQCLRLWNCPYVFAAFSVPYYVKKFCPIQDSYELSIFFSVKYLVRKV